MALSSAKKAGISFETTTKFGDREAYEFAAPLRPIIYKKLSESGLFSEVMMLGEGDLRKEYHLQVNYRYSKSDNPLFVMSYIFSSLTATILPGYIQINLEGNAVLYHNEKIVRTYKIKDRYNTWFELLLFPAAPFFESMSATLDYRILDTSVDRNRINATSGDVMDAILKDLKKDGAPAS